MKPKQEVFNTYPLELSLVKNFMVVYGETYNSPVFLISQLLGAFIASDIKYIFTHLKLTPVQEAIVREHNLLNKLIGQLNMSAKHDIRNGEGFKPTGITKIYFKSFQSAVSGNIIQKSFQAFCTSVLEDGFSFFRKESEEHLYATHDSFNNRFEDRQKEVIFHLFLTIIDHANDYQIELLVKELKNIENDIVNKLSLHRKFDALFVKSSPFTFSCTQAQNKVIKKYAQSHYALRSMLLASTTYKFIKVLDSPDKMSLDQRKKIFLAAQKSFTPLYVLCEKNIYYMSAIDQITPLEVKKFSPLKALFPLEENTLIKATSRALLKIRLLTNHQPNILPSLPSELYKNVGFYLKKSDFKNLIVNKSTYAYLEEKERALSDKYSRGEEYRVYHTFIPS